MAVKNMGISVGEDNFSKIRSNNLYYVDKTLFISDFLEDISTNITLITRPTKFGKTLNISMLKYFLSEDYKREEIIKMFKGLNIMNHKDICSKHMNKHSVIHIDLKEAIGYNWRNTMLSFNRIMANKYRESRDKILPHLRKEDLEYYNKIESNKGTKEDYLYSLVNLIVFLNRSSSEKIIILIDGYDSIINQGFICGYYKKSKIFFTKWYNNLKGVLSSTKILLAGEFNISNDNSFIRTSRININSVLSKNYEDHFGFTEKEAEDMAIYYERSLEVLKDWYKGYNFGNNTLYNPWSITKYCKSSGLVEENWIDPNANKLISRILLSGDLKVKEEIESMLKGEILKRKLSSELKSKNASREDILTLLLQSGYLTYKNSEDNLYELTIPNKEVKKAISSLIDRVNL